MDSPQSFRSAFHGFNREDVVNYISYISTKHETQINELKSEADDLRTQLAEKENMVQSAGVLAAELGDLRGRNEALKTELEAARELVAEKNAQIDGLQKDVSNRNGETEELRDTIFNRDAQIEELEKAVADRDAELEALKKAAADRDAELEALRQELEQAKTAAVQPRREEPVTRWSEELNAYRRAEKAERRARERVNQMYDKANGALSDASVRVEKTAEQIAEMVIKVEADLELLRQAMEDSENTLADTAVVLGAIRPEMD